MPLSYKLTAIIHLLKLTGRYDILPDGITMDNACNCIAFTADCQGDIIIDLDINITTKGDKNLGGRYFTVYIDGVKQSERAVAMGVPGECVSSTLTVAAGLEKGVHTIEVYRQNEPLRGSMLLKSITITGEFLEKPKDRNLYIEFVGDSITAGYGNLRLGKILRPGHPDNSDATSTYAFRIAKEFDTDISVLCRSGLAFSSETIPFEKLYTDTCFMTRPGKKYTVGRHPDFVIINLGTNDAAHADYNTLTHNVKKAISTVREVYPQSVIIWLYGLMGDKISDYIKQGLEECGGEDNKIYYCGLETDYSGGGGHPSLAGNKRAAEMVTAFIKDKGLIKC